MSETVDCKCGAKIRLPAQTENRSFRCPVCKKGIALTVDAKVLSSATLDPRHGVVTCPICQSGISGDEFAVTCPRCDQVHHRECWAEVGGCGTYGCEQAPSLDKEDEASQQPLSAWGDTKQCPVCGEQIKAIAVKCRYCESHFDTVDPLTLGDVHRKLHKADRIKSLQKTVITLFVLSLIGCLAPIMAVVSLCVVLPKHKQLAAEGPLYLVLGYSAVILSTLYSILIALFALF